MGIKMSFAKGKAQAVEVVSVKSYGNYVSIKTDEPTAVPFNGEALVEVERKEDEYALFHEQGRHELFNTTTVKFTLSKPLLEMMAREIGMVYANDAPGVARESE